MLDNRITLPNVPEHKKVLLANFMEQLRRVPGMVAIVLGGSYASGMQHEHSDLDIGLYYHEATPFAIEAIRQIANSVAVAGRATVTNFYEWGPWVNGGAWIHTAQGKVDFLYRNLDQVQRTLTDAQQGITQHDYDQQPTHGFYSVIYLAETQICIPLYDPNNLIAHLKQQVAPYPPKLKEKIILDSLWSAEFSLLFARNFATQGDIYNTVGCLTRIVSNLTQALFAINERYFLRDKQVMETIAGFAILPPAYVAEVNSILASPGNSAAALTKSVSELEQTWRSVVALTGELYQPKFHV